MKHIFYVYNMANVDDHIYYPFLDNLKKEFASFGYDVGTEIQIRPFTDKSEYNDCRTKSAIVLSTDSVCNASSAYGSAEDFWPYIEEKIDLVLISGVKPSMYWPSILTPILPLESLNYTTAIRILINYNTTQK